jgi:hypothetical protein
MSAIVAALHVVRHARWRINQHFLSLALGYEDLNDHGALRTDTLLQTAVGRAEELASAPTLCRLEGRADRAMAWALHGVLLDLFVESFA